MIIPTLRVLTLNKIYHLNLDINLGDITEDCYNLIIVFNFIRDGKYHYCKQFYHIIEILNFWYNILYIVSKIPRYQLYEFKKLIKYSTYKHILKFRIWKPIKYKIYTIYDLNDNINNFFFILREKRQLIIRKSDFLLDCMAYRILLEHDNIVLSILENMGFDILHKDFIMMYLRKQQNICEFEKNRTHSTPLHYNFRIFLNKRFKTKDFLINKKRIIYNGFTFESFIDYPEII